MNICPVCGEILNINWIGEEQVAFCSSCKKTYDANDLIKKGK